MADNSDFLQRFMLENAGVSGALVRLESTWTQVRERADYPPSVARVLAETLAASALFTGNIKFKGRLSIQLKGGETLPLVFSECTHEGRLRGLARWHDEIAADFPVGSSAVLVAITIEHADSQLRSQGLISVEENASLAVAFEQYFDRSEQLPTRLLLASDGIRCGGIMLQRVASTGGHDAVVDADAWNRVNHLLTTLSAEELLSLPAEILLQRLFHEEDVRLSALRPLHFGCSCSRERVGGMLRALGHDEAIAAVREDGTAEVICEFCNTSYRFDNVDIELLFSDQPVAPAPRTNQ